MRRTGAVALAGLLATGLATATLAADVSLDKIAGFYAKSFMNGDTTGAKFRSKNTLEIVKISPAAAFVRTHLEFFNGHICEVSGVAKIEGGTLIYRGDTSSENKRCLFTLRIDKTKIAFEDPEGACRPVYCGARGGLDGISFALAGRRAIRDLAAVRRSEGYKDAIEEYEEEQKKAAR